MFECVSSFMAVAFKKTWIHSLTRHENFHGKFSLCAEYLIRSIGEKFTCRLKVFTDYSEGNIRGKGM